MASCHIMVPISTRGVGFTVRFLIAAMKSELNDVCDFYKLTNALYRVTLLRIHLKINNSLQYVNGLVPGFEPPIFIDSDSLNELDKLDVDFIAIHRLLSTVGFTRYFKDTFIPRFPCLIHNSCCDPINVNFHNLHDTVNLLADPRTDERTRYIFWKYNPIPGAKWGSRRKCGAFTKYKCAAEEEQFEPSVCLLNPYDIMPPDYGPNQLRKDVQIILYCILRIAGCSTKYTLRNTNADMGVLGTVSQLISSRVASIRCPTYTDIGLTNITGEIYEIWSPRWMKARQSSLGVYCLFGEISLAIRDTRCLAIRYREIATQHYYYDYFSVQFVAMTQSPYSR